MDEEKDVYNLPIAAFTFGKNGQPLPYYPIPDLKDVNNENKIKNNNNINEYNSIESKESSKLSNDDSDKRFSFKNIINKNKNNNNKENSNERNNFNSNIDKHNFNNNNFIFIDKEDSNSSYIKIILYALSYMPLINNYIINEIQVNEDSKKKEFYDMLIIIQEILIKISKIKNANKNQNNNRHINNIIIIDQLKDNLSELFKNKNKFMKNSPDDPMDFLYIIINFIHNLSTKNELNNDRRIKHICNECFSHKNLSNIIYKVYECECRGQSKPTLSINNYILEIPINIIINKFSKNSLTDMNQMLFNYYHKLIDKIKINGNCPKYGQKCKINKVHKKYILKKCPSYLIFNLENDIFKKNELFCSLNNILKNFVLIPHILNINTLFNIKQNNDKTYYELIGILFIKISKIYSCLFKSKDSFYYYEDNISLSFNNYYDIILFSLKNGIIPIALFYQNMDLNSDKINIDKNSISYNTDYELSNEQIIKLEKYVKNADSLNQNLKNKIRTSENIISNNIAINYKINNSQNNTSYSDKYNSSRFSNSINSYQKNEYICNHCERINKIENAMCFFCGFNNKDVINNININKNNQNKNVRKLKNNIIIKKKIILKKDNRIPGNGINGLGEIEDEYKNIDPHVLKYFDMPRPYIPQKKDDFTTSSQNQNTEIIKDKIPSNKKNVNKKIKKIMNININNSYVTNNNLNKNKNLRNNSLNKKYISKTNRNSNDLYLNEKNYTEKKVSQNNSNNQLNINLKINNNNNYNIFEFGNKKNLIHLNNFNNYGIEENFINNKNLIKKLKIKTGTRSINKSKISDNNIKYINSSDIINFNTNSKRISSESKHNLNQIKFFLPSEKWTCLNCFNQNNNDVIKCIYCKKERKININYSPKNKSKIIENKINYNNNNNFLSGQISTKNKKIVNI